MTMPPGTDTPMGEAWREVEVWDVAGGPRGDCVAEEVPVALVLNGISHAVMMCSPDDLEDFARGFVYTEGLADDPADVYGVDIVPVAQGIEARVHVSAEVEWRLRERRRTLAGRTGCGLCGTDSLAQVRRPLPRLQGRPVPAAAVLHAHRTMPAWQALQRRTGATHAAAWCDAGSGEVRLVREDVGRHNALDKLIGALLAQGADRGDGMVCITSRASFEMVQKCAVAGIATLAAVSAPTALAVEVARDSGVLLMGFVRGDSLVTYTFPQRLT
jgi:FdhD protein